MVTLSRTAHVPMTRLVNELTQVPPTTPPPWRRAPGPPPIPVGRPVDFSDPPPVPYDQIVQAPVPVIPLAYASATPAGQAEMTYRRPGRLVTIGILSLIFGLLTIGINGAAYWGLHWAHDRLNRMTALRAGSTWSAAAAAPAPISPAKVTAHLGDFVRPRGLRQQERQTVTAAVAAKIALPPDRAILLERFLRDVGRDAFGESAGSASAVATTIKDACQLPTGRDGAGAFGTHLIVTDHGRVLLDNSTATFVPAAPGARTIILEGNFLNDGPTGAKWSAAALDEWIEGLRAKSPNGQMTGKQAAVLLECAAQAPARNRASGQRDDYGFAAIPSYPMNVQWTGTAIMQAQLGGGRTYVLPDGRTAPMSAVPYGFGPGPQYKPNARPVAARSPLTTPTQALAILRVGMVDAVAGAGAGFMLLLAGIATLADWRVAPRMHRAWALLKVPLCLGSVAIAFWGGSMLPGVLSNRYFPAAKIIATAAASLAYPAVVLLVLRSRVARGYYNAVGHPQRVLDARAWSRLLARVTEFLGNPVGRGALWGCCVVSSVAALAHAVALANALQEQGRSQEAAMHAGGMMLASLVAVAAWLTVRWSLIAGMGADARDGAGGVA